LVAWYRSNARSLPWRDDPSPYAVLLSELMLQQTRVDTVIERFRRFLERWPTLADLAAAEEDEVLHEWAGLGYYARARNLHAAARAAHAVGGLPRDPKALRRLPGLGPYTAGAIASIAFGVAAPLVDGNVERVLFRVDARTEDPKTAAGKRALWARAAELVACEEPSDLNQGLMELGATVCSPRAPACPRCPWADLCAGRALGIAEDLPRRPPRKKPRPVRGAAGILRRDGAVLLGQRPGTGLLASLWEPVGADLASQESASDGVRRAFLDRVSLEVGITAHLGQIVHVFSHRRLTLEVFEVAVAGGDDPVAGGGYQALRWVDPAAPGEVALSKLARRTLDLALEPPAQTSLLAAEPSPE